jgi:hypothetical protein
VNDLEIIFVSLEGSSKKDSVAHEVHWDYVKHYIAIAAHVVRHSCSETVHVASGCGERIDPARSRFELGTPDYARTDDNDWHRPTILLENPLSIGLRERVSVREGTKDLRSFLLQLLV